MILWDTDQRGFAVRIGPRNTRYPNGKISYFVQKRTGGRGSKEFRYVFGQYPQMDIKEARNRALSLISDIRGNINVSKQRKETIDLRRAEAEASRTKKFEDIFQEYRKTKSDGSYYWEVDLVYYQNKYFVPRFGSLAVTEITKDDIRTLLKSIKHKSVAKKAEAQLRPFFKYCVQEDIIYANPMTDLAPLPKLKSRDRVLSREELVAFWKATEEMKKAGSLFGHVYQLLLLTGQRLREIAHMEHDELNLLEQIFNLSAKRSKNGLAHIVHLSDLALEIITTAPRNSNQFVFSYNRHALSGFSVSKRILEQTMQKYLDKPLKPFQLRDLRRTFATNCAELGIDHNIADRILNHVSDSQSGVKGIYQRYEFLPERKAAMLTWNNYVQSLIGLR
jgi:integrase